MKERWFEFYDDLWKFAKAAGDASLPTCPIGKQCAPDRYSCCGFEPSRVIEYPFEIEWQNARDDFPKKECGHPCNQLRPWMCVFWPVMPVAYRRDPADKSEWGIQFMFQCELAMLAPESTVQSIELADECGWLLVNKYPDLIDAFMKRQWEEFTPTRTLGIIARAPVLKRILTDPMAPRLVRTLMQFSHCVDGGLNMEAFGIEPLFHGKRTVRFEEATGAVGKHMVVVPDEE